MRLAGVLLTLLFAAPAAWAAPPDAQTQAEISHLLSYLAASDCDFYRNRSWHDAAEARDHLQHKLDYLAKRSLVGTTEDFISRAASSSSMSGEEYLVRCPGATAVKSRVWLTEELVRYRATRQPAMPR